MIQRIQTIYLVLAILTIVAYLFAPVIQYEALDVNYVRNLPTWEVAYFVSGYYVFVAAILSAIAAGFSLIAIFLFSKRGIQSLLCWVAILFHLLAVGYVYYVFQTKETPIDIIYTAWNLAAIPPLVFLLLAYFAIQKDEALIKSMDRLRD
ncbi:MAG: DUF4293 domain-containing protein [Chitinophagales bacterium]|nr:DUF4293 domain-containing protein [Chitinophagales bacterium]